MSDKLLSNESILDALHWRYATKHFDSTKKVSEEDVQTLCEAMRLSPSSFGFQPWKFVVVTDPDLRKKLREAAYGQAQVTDASHLIVMCAKNTLTEEDIRKFVRYTETVRGLVPHSLEGAEQMMLGSLKRMTPGDIVHWNKRQLYLPLGSILTLAALKGIDACPMEGFDSAAVTSLLNLTNEGFTAVAFCALGYRSPEDKYADAKKSRFPADTVIVRK